MRKVLLLALITMFFATACNKSEETAPAAPDAAASAAAPMASDAASAAASAVSSDAASPAAAASPASP